MGWDTLHSAATAELTEWTTDDVAQLVLRDEYLALLDRDPDAVRKAGPPGHLTASCMVLDPTGQRVLLTHHRKANTWLQFGGHLELSDTSLRDGALREAREESGIDAISLVGGIVQLDRHDLVGAFGQCRTHWDVRYAGVTEQTAPQVSDESLDVAWFDADDLPNPRLAALVGLARERLAGDRPRCMLDERLSAFDKTGGAGSS